MKTVGRSASIKAPMHAKSDHLPADASENGILPPWTVEAQKKAADKKAERK
jgi:hypothetical protein